MNRIWWEQVPNARLFLDTILESISNEKSVILVSKNPLPWRDYFFTKLNEEFRQTTATKSIEKLTNVKNPGKYLMDKYCNSEKQASYRPRPGNSFALFLATSNDIMLHNKMFWVCLDEDPTQSSLNEWTSFISEYIKERGRNSPQATFLIEYRSSKSVTNKKGISAIYFDDQIGDFDRFVFCMLAASSVNESSNIKKYLSELVSNVVGNNIELYEEIISNYRVFLSDPFSFIIEATSNVQIKDPLFVFSKKRDDIEHDIWLSQLRTVYPILEDYREKFVNKHRKDISRNLPITSSSGEVYSMPEDVELGTLRYLADSQKIATTSAEHDELVLHTMARNDLAHLKPIAISDVRKIL